MVLSAYNTVASTLTLAYCHQLISIITWGITWEWNSSSQQSFIGHLLYQPIVGITIVTQTVKCLSAMQKTQVQSLGWEDPLEKEMAAHSSILAWKIPWTEEPGRLPSMGWQRVRHDWATSLSPPSWASSHPIPLGHHTVPSCYIATSHQQSILHMVLYIGQCYSGSVIVHFFLVVKLWTSLKAHFCLEEIQVRNGHGYKTERSRVQGSMKTSPDGRYPLPAERTPCLILM